MKKRKQNATAKPVNVEQRQKPKVIVLDIETCPILAYTFGTRKVNISLEQVVKPTAILSVSWKFLDGDEVYFWSNEGQKDPWDDLSLCQSLWGLINQADAVIGHNCLEESTPVLTRDLRWVPVGSLRKGDQLLGFDEGRPPGTPNRYRDPVTGKLVRYPSTRRTLRPSTVTAIETKELDAVRVTLSNGDEVITTPEHPWLVKTAKSGDLRWVASTDLKPGYHQMTKLRPPRMLSEFDRKLLWGRTTLDGQRSDLVTVVSVEPVGKRRIAVMSTSTRTYFGAGYAMHNCNQFDMPIIYGRFYHHSLPPVRKPQNLDTLQMARQIGRHFSGKLAHLSGKLDAKKSEHAKFPGFKLWAETLKGNPEAWQEMQEYNAQDVRATEALFKDMLPYAKTGLYFEDAPADVPVCPRCGSHHVQKRGATKTMGGTYQRFKCLDCGGWSQSRFTQRDRKVSRNTLRAV